MNCPHCNQPVALVPVGTNAANSAAIREGLCPVHRVPWVFKSGVSQKTGQPYAFWACDERDEAGYCKKSAPKGWQPPAAPRPARSAEAEELDNMPF